MNQETDMLWGILEKHLEGKNPRIDSLPETRRPLFLLLDVPPDLVGFATVDGKPEQDYWHALEAFQTLYADFENEWPKHDLTLILCTHNPKPARSADWTEVELNRYFCRKFVIDMNADLDAQIKHLPFVPLNPAAVGLARPLSAQSLLNKKHGLTTMLAKSLAVPGQGPESVVDRCLKGDMGEPKLKRFSIDAFVSPPKTLGPKVSLSEVHIESFRAYTSQTLAFNHDMIVLYGPNGLGKTSLFDALDFVCTGGVWRFDERFGKEKEASLMGVLTNIGSAPSQARVKATMSIQGNSFRIERRVSDLKGALIDGQQKDRKAILTRLAGLTGANSMDLRIENFVRLFRASHFFGQDSASLTSDVRDKSVLREETVSRMLALQDYVEALNKSKKIISELHARATTQEMESERTLAAIRDRRTELGTLKQNYIALEAPEAVLTRGRDLGRRILQSGQIQIEVPVEIDSPTVQGWRASLDEEVHRLRTQLERLLTLQPRLAERVNLRRADVELSKLLEPKRQQLSLLQQSHSANKALLDTLRRNCNQLIQEEKDLSERSEAVKWLLDNVAEYRRLQAELSSKEMHLEQAKLEFAEGEAALKALDFERELVEEGIEELQRDIQSNEAELSGVDTFLSGVGEWRRALAEQEELQERLASKERNLAATMQVLQAARSTLDSAISAKERSQQQVTRLQQVQSELQTTLDNILPHVTSEVCPVCGTAHQSRDELLNKIRHMRGVQSEALAIELGSLDREKGRVEQCQQSVGDSDRLARSIMSELEIARVELSTAKSRANDRLKEALALRIASEATPDSCDKAARAKAVELSEVLTAKRQELAAGLSETERIRRRIDVGSEEHRSQSKRLAQHESQYELLAQSLAAVEKQAKKRGVDPGQTEESARGESTAIAEQLGKVEASKLNTLEQIETLGASVDDAEHELGELEKEIPEIQANIAGSRRGLEEIQRLLIVLDLEPDATEKDVTTFREQVEARRAVLSDLRDQVINFEIAMDAAQTQAALARLQTEISRLYATKQDADDKLSILKTWGLYFEQVHDALRRVQDELLSEYINKYGPLASMIQERLRDVYGFKGVKLRAKKGEIEVTVQRGGQQYPPSDYFSESQLQIVMLSLFLSAVLTQTWSSFAPVLLDHPVTHFDDLNAYALLDVLRGLIDEPGQRHQFIISTCEERLYRLMKQRLPKGKGSVAFYEFLSIGENGPVIREG